jgi:hypothetical protein
VNEQEGIECIEKASDIFSYIEKIEGSKRALEICNHLGWGTPQILNKYTLIQMKNITDKFIKFNKILKESKNGTEFNRG